MSFIRRTIRLYQTQFQLLWEWRGGRGALIKRGIVALLAAMFAFNITAFLFPFWLHINEVGGGLIAVIVLAVLNLIVRPVFIGLAASRSVVVLVLLTLLFQAFVFWLLDPLVPAVTVDAGLLGLLIVSFTYGFIQAGIAALFGLGEEGSYYATLVRTMASRRSDVIKTDQPGLVVIQVDGLSHDVISHAVRAGRVPEMSRWIRGGTHRLGHWDALLPSTTPASQAGILHGNNDGIPNFRWWEKKNKRLLVANHPEDATEIERRVSNGEGLLSPGGTSISNIFTGDGDRAFLVMSTIKVKERGLGQSDAFAWFFVSPYNYLVMGAKFLAEVIKEIIQSKRQIRAGVTPHMGHHPRHAVPVRARRDQRGPPRAGHLADHPGDGPRHPRDLHGLHRLRRDRAPLGPGAPRVAGRARRRGPGAGHPAARLEGRGAALPLRHPRRPRPEPGRDVPPALWVHPPGPRPEADGRRDVGRGGHRGHRGLGPAEHVPG
jgi:uncharacterized membrane protein YvlD (DUF360 family)